MKEKIRVWYLARIIRHRIKTGEYWKCSWCKGYVKGRMRLHFCAPKSNVGDKLNNVD